MNEDRREPGEPAAGTPPPVPSAYDATVRAGPGSPPPPGRTPPATGGGETLPRLGGYRLLRKLGSGGMGQIYLAVQESVGRQVAIKVLPGSALHDSDAVARFQREIQVLGQLKHPGICPVLDSGLDGRTHFYVMEHIRGMDLARVLGAQRVDPRRAASIAAQVAQALHSAHQAGVVHRDVKPLNIMLTRGDRPRDRHAARADSTSLGGAFRRFLSWATVAGSAPQPLPPTVAPADGAADAAMPSPEWRDRAVLIDFGLARDGAAASHLTASGALMGTPAYMAPEQARGDRRAIGPATDVYGLGATLYEMLTLRPPFGGEAMGEVLARVQSEEPASVRKLNPLVDRDLETIVQKAMEKEPARRYPSAEAMAQDLDRWLAGEAIQARRAGLGYRVRKRLLKNKAATTAAAIAVLLAAVGLWQTFGPGEVLLDGIGLEGAAVFLDGKPVQGTRFRVWPGSHTVRVTLPEFADFSDQVEVRARTTERIGVALISRYGFLTVTSEPAGAEVLDRGVRLGVTPLVRCRVLAGERFIELRLRDYEPSTFPVLIRPGDETPALVRQLRHETGTLTLTSDPPELGIDLWAEGSKRPIVAAAPAREFPLATGKYRVVAHARNHFPQEFPLEIVAGRETKRNVTLTSLVRWRTTADPGPEGTTVGDLNGDGRPDIVLASKTPARIRAIDGRNGELIWIVRKPPMSASYGMPLSLCDLDGDLEPELVYSGGDRLVALDGRTGVEKAAFDVPGLRDAVAWGDMDADGVSDFLGHTSSVVLMLGGRDGRTLWSCAVAGWPAYARGDFDADGSPDVLLADNGGTAQALKGTTGQAIWQLEGWRLNGAMCCVDLDGDGADDILGGNDVNAPVALRGRDGSVLWSGRPDDRIMYLPPVAADLDGNGALEAVYCRGDLLEIRDALGGGVLREHRIYPGCSPAVCDVDGDGAPDLVLSAFGALTAMKPFTGEPVWQFDSNSTTSLATPLLDDFDGDGFQDLLLLAPDGTVACVNTVEPPVLWRQGQAHLHTAEPEVLGSPARFVFLAGAPHRLLDPVDGRILAELPYANCKMSAVYSPAPPFRVALDGLDRVLLEVQEDPPALRVVWNAKDEAVLSSPTLADLNGDGVLDFLTGDGEGGQGVRASDGRSGNLLWNAPLGRPWRADIAVWQELVWVPAGNALHGLDPVTGREVRSLDLLAAASGGLAVGDDLVGWSIGGRVIRFRATTKGLEEVWRREIGVGIAARGAAAEGPLLVIQGGRGRVVALDAATGEERWRQVVEQNSGGGPGLRDLDGDGLPEVAVSSFDAGWVWVLDGRDGRILWSWRTGVSNGWSRPRWADLDGDRAPEIICTFRDGRAYALKVRLHRPPPVIVTSPDGNPFHARAASQLEERRRAVVAARRNTRWTDVVALADGHQDPWFAAEGARASARLGDAAAAGRFSALARRLHVRRLDVDLSACLALHGPDRAAALRLALAAAPPDQIAGASPPPGLEGEWREALLAAARDAEARDSWEQAVALHGARMDYPSALAACEKASRERAPGARLRLTLGRAAVAANEFDAARGHFRAVLGDTSLAGTAQAELDALVRLADQLRGEMRTAFGTGAWEAGTAAGERLVRLRSGDVDAWNEYAWMAATSGSPPPEVARRGLEAARRAVALMDGQGVPPGNRRAGVLDTLAAALFAAGEVAESVRVQEEAIGMTSGGDLRADLQQRLEQYRRALRGE
ncbi:MAG: VCBS repeat-containing protein [Planctomycetia bacterium]|nr:VCBS repeat-containing protein [Planctomycetia bacterium]